VARDFDRHGLVNGTLGWLFAATGALAILLAAARQAGLPDDATASWIFGGYALGGLATIVMSVLYRQPLGMAWSMPAALVAAPMFGHYPLSAIVGTYLATGLLLTLLGLTGAVSWLMDRVPMPVMMGMVAGVFLPYGVKVLQGFVTIPIPTIAMVAAFILVPMLPGIGRRLPPVLGALVVGAIAAVFADRPAAPPLSLHIVVPYLVVPTFSWSAIVESMLPLAVTVLGIQNPQGFAILRQTGHDVPVNAMTTACGIASFFFGIVACVPACMTGPSNAIIVASGERERHYVGAIVFGVEMLIFGLFAPTAVALAGALPGGFIAVLGGLALLPVLRSAFVIAFGGGRFTFGALVALMTAVSNVTLLHVGAAFWALVFGVGASLAFERDDFRQHRNNAGDRRRDMEDR
jgi:benzoate membrane transport protein